MTLSTLVDVCGECGAPVSMCGGDAGHERTRRIIAGEPVTPPPLSGRNAGMWKLIAWAVLVGCTAGAVVGLFIGWGLS